MLWPDATERPVPPEVEAESPEVAADFHEAVAVFPKSKKASAALARRCLQAVLVSKAGAKARDLAAQIDEVLSSLPPELAQVGTELEVDVRGKHLNTTVVPRPFYRRNKAT